MSENIYLNDFASGVLVTKEAPDFTATTVMPDGSIDESFNLTDYIKGKIGVLFFYPLDFTFVCPTEIIAFHNRVEDFEKRGAKLIGISVDSQFSHAAWRNTPINQGGIGPVHFPLVSDITKDIASDYDVLINNAVALRGTFIIDKEGIIRHQTVNDLPLGRNVDETLRIIDAIQFHEKNGEVCPAGWQQGEDGFVASGDGVAKYLDKNSDKL